MTLASLKPNSPAATDDCGPDVALMEALAAAALGRRVFPVHSISPRAACTCGRDDCRNIGKHPRVRNWPTVATTDPRDIRQWARTWLGCNWGCATGAGSGVIVLDVDPRHQGDSTLRSLQDQHGELPATPTVRTGGGGIHLYFMHPGIPVGNDSAGRKLGVGIDVRGDGGFVILPGSDHASGSRYAWETGRRPRDVPLAPLPGWLRGRLARETEWAECTEVNRVDGSNLSVLSVHSAHSAHSVSVVDLVEGAIVATLPRSEGERNRRLFDFARRLKAIRSLADAPPRTLRPLVERWHRRALPVIGTKPFEDTWADFVNIKVRHAHGSGPLADALTRAEAAEAPLRASQMYDAPETILLLKLCRELQQNAGKGPFFLSCDTVAELLHLDRVTAWRRLRVLRTDSWIEAVEDPTSTRATRYRWIGDDAENRS